MAAPVLPSPGKLYFVKTPFYLKKIFRSMTWEFPGDEKTMYLTFDDGPNPGPTEYALDMLAEHNAHGTFFCLGKQVEAHPALYKRILDEGHSVGNHTYEHLNGWKTGDEEYLEDVKRGGTVIHSPLFRPPYGRIKITQLEALRDEYQIVMWDVISGDFDTDLSREKCLSNILDNAKAGSIVVLHDNVKSQDKLHYTLPRVLEHFSGLGFRFEPIAMAHAVH